MQVQQAIPSIRCKVCQELVNRVCCSSGCNNSPFICPDATKAPHHPNTRLEYHFHQEKRIVEFQKYWQTIEKLTQLSRDQQNTKQELIEPIDSMIENIACSLDSIKNHYQSIIFDNSQFNQDEMDLINELNWENKHPNITGKQLYYLFNRKNTPQKDFNQVLKMKQSILILLEKINKQVQNFKHFYESNQVNFIEVANQLETPQQKIHSQYSESSSYCQIMEIVRPKRQKLSTFEQVIEDKIGQAIQIAQKRNYKQAIKILQDIKKFDPQNWNCYHLIAQYMSHDSKNKVKNYDIIKQNYSTALKLNPNKSQIYNGLALVAKEQNNIEQAIRFHNKSIQMEPCYLYYFNKAYTLFCYNQYTQAIFFFQKALSQAEPDDKKQLFMQIGYCYKELMEFTKAKDYFQKAISHTKRKKCSKCLKEIKELNQILNKNKRKCYKVSQFLFS